MGREPEVISVTDLRNSTREVIENAHFRGRRYLIERAGQPMIVVLGVDEYRQLADAYDPCGETKPCKRPAPG